MLHQVVAELATKARAPPREAKNIARGTTDPEIDSVTWSDLIY